jgi:hypothetical protein
MSVSSGTRNTAGRSSFCSRFKKVKRLNQAALAKVDLHAGAIIDSLYVNAIAGGVTSARLLFELAEGSVEAEEALMRRPLRSLALALANDEPWTEEVDESRSETGFGGNEPE